MCLKCRSTRLRIRRVTGIERLLVLLTQKRKYVCGDCGYTFRAVDRRSDPREQSVYTTNRAGHFRP